MGKAIGNVLCLLVLASLRFGAADSVVEYIKRCELLGKTAAVSIKKEACEVIVGLCGAPKSSQPLPSQPSLSPPSIAKNMEGIDMKDICQAMLETDCPSEAIEILFREQDDCYLLEVHGPETPSPGCEDADAVEDRFDREVLDRCKKVEPLEWSPPVDPF